MGKKKKKANSVNNDTIPSNNKVEEEIVKDENIEEIEETEIKNDDGQIEETEIREDDDKKEETNIKLENESNENVELKKEEPFEQVKETKKSHKALFVVSFCFIAIVFLLVVFSTIFALITSHQNTIIKGVKIKDIDISGLTKEEALQKVSNDFNKKLEKQIILQHNDYEIAVFFGQFDVSFALEEAVNIAYNKGRMRKYFSK